MNYMSSNADVWLGWAYWTGGPWYPVDLSNPLDCPQMSILTVHPSFSATKAERIKRAFVASEALLKSVAHPAASFHTCRLANVFDS
jgi:hypothetical protein